MIVLVGAGNIGRELLARLSRDIDITCIDTNPETKEIAEELRGTGRTRVIIGDATSRLVLEEARVDESEVVIISTTTEKINIEVARVLREHFSPRRVISVGLTETGMKRLTELGAEVKSIFTASSIDIRNMIEHQAKTAHGIGIGRNEILEVEVHPHSRLTNKPLGSIAPIRWRVGILYRDGNIIVPKPDTVLKGGDKIVILGEPGVLGTVADLLSAEFEKFPLEYGAVLFAVVSGNEDEAFFEEVKYLLDLLPLDRLCFVSPPLPEGRTAVPPDVLARFGWTSAETVTSLLSLPDAMRQAADRTAPPGLVVLPPRVIGRRGAGLLRSSPRSFLLDLVQAVKCPVILAKGSFPYTTMLAPEMTGTDFRQQISKAAEVSHAISAQLSAALVKPSLYIATQEENERFEEGKKIVSNMSLVHRKKIGLEILEGNPIREIVKCQSGYQLLMIGMKGWSQARGLKALLSPDVAGGVLAKATISCMVLPAIEEAL